MRARSEGLEGKEGEGGGVGFFFQAEDGIRDRLVTGVQSVLFRSHFRNAYLGDFLNAKASTYSASGGKNPYFFVFSGCKTQNQFFFKLSLQPWDLARKMRLEKWCLQR